MQHACYEKERRRSKYKHIAANDHGYFWQKQHTDTKKLYQKKDRTQL